MAKKVVKKIDVKKVSKLEVSGIVKTLFEERGIEVLNGQDFGMTEGTLILRMEKTDIQVKLITPKTGIERYEVLEEE